MTTSARSARRHTAAALLLLAVFGVAILWPQLSQMKGLPDFGDPIFSIWRLGWTYQQLQGDDRHLFDANIFHPERSTFALSDSILLPGVAAAPLRLIGVHPATAYNVLLLASFLLSAWTAYFLVRRLTGSASAGFISGLIFGFYPYRFEHYSHLELQMTFWMPLTLLTLHRFCVEDRNRWLYVTALLLAGQLYSSMYFGVFLPLFAGVALLVWCLVRRPHRSQMKYVPGVIGASVMALVLVAPLASAYLRSDHVRGERGLNEVAHYSATPLDYLRAHRRSAVWANLTPAGRQEERQLFPGLTVLILAAAGLSISRDRMRWAVGVAGVFAFDASLGTNGIMYPLMYEWLPPFRSMRVPARFSILVGLSLAVLAGYAISAVSQHSARLRTGIVILATAGIAADVWPALVLRNIWVAPPSIYAALENRDAVLAEFPAGGDFPALPYMYFSLWHWHPMVNGYSGFQPASYAEIAPTLEQFPETATLDALQSRGVTHVTVNCVLFDLAGFGGRCERTLQAVAREPRLREVIRAEWEGDTVVLLELLR